MYIKSRRRIGNVKVGKFTASVEDMASEDYNEEEYENLNDIETVLDSIGIKLRENATTYKDTEEVLQEIADIWDTLDETTQNALTTALAGTRQRVTKCSVYIVIYIGHNTYMQVKGKVLH